MKPARAFAPARDWITLETNAANVAAVTAEGLGTFAGPALSGLLLTLLGPVGAYLGVLAVYALAVGRYQTW